MFNKQVLNKFGWGLLFVSVVVVWILFQLFPEFY